MKKQTIVKYYAHGVVSYFCFNKYEDMIKFIDMIPGGDKGVDIYFDSKRDQELTRRKDIIGWYE